MANLVPDDAPGACCHGILHAITPAMLAALEHIETHYDVVDVSVTPYAQFAAAKGGGASDGTAAAASAPASKGDAPPLVQQQQPGVPPGTPGVAVAAVTFIVPPERLQQMRAAAVAAAAAAAAPDKQPGSNGSNGSNGSAAGGRQQQQPGDALPSERYITIITAGLRAIGADPAWVERIAKQPCIPSRAPADYRRLPPPPDGGAGLQQFTPVQLAAHEGVVEHGTGVFALGSRVLRADVSRCGPGSFFVEMLRRHMSGRDHVFGICMALYEPRLPHIEAPGDVTGERCGACGLHARASGTSWCMFDTLRRALHACSRVLHLSQTSTLPGRRTSCWTGATSLAWGWSRSAGS